MNERRKTERQMRRILRAVMRSGSLPCANEDWLFAIQKCGEAGYLSGIDTETAYDGKINIRINYLSVTNAGMKFAYPYRDMKFIIPTSISVISVIANVVQAVLLYFTSHPQ